MAKWAMPRFSTPAQYAILLIDLVESRGHPRAAILRETSLETTGLGGIGARVGAEDFIRLVTNAFDLTADPALGLHLGMRLNMSAHAVLGQAFMACSDLAQVLVLFRRYYHLLAPGLELELASDEHKSSLRIINGPVDIPVSFSCEIMFAGVQNTLRGLLNRPDLQLPVAFPYPAPAHAAEYHRIFGRAVTFDARRGQVDFERKLLATPLPSSNPALLALYEAECGRLLHDLEEDDTVADQTLRLLRKLEGQYPRMPQVARMLNLSPRTYRRRLEQEGAAFQELLDQVRSEHAAHYLQHSRMPLATIAYHVGFNDPSNFRRAFQRWTGQSPLAWRRQARLSRDGR